MGNLLRLLSRDDSNCCSPQKYDIYLDFENASPTENELAVYEEVNEVLKRCDEILQELEGYRGAGEEIREAISQPSDEKQILAWKAIAPLVMKLKKFYMFSMEVREYRISVKKLVPKILEHLSSGPSSTMENLETQQAIVKQFAEILHFTLKFDELKMNAPAIQNDFSYYRRTISRSKISKVQEQQNGTDVQDDFYIPSDFAINMSMFYAHATPMLKVLSDATSAFVIQSETPSTVQNTTEMLGTMARVCQRMIDNQDLINRFKCCETHLFVLRVMVGLIILYDHVHPSGAFAKTSCIDIKGCIKVLKEQPTSNSENLLNALRYTTMHLNDDSTPKNIRAMLAT
ncbi:unnamed protein product [Notodromas monacha]|uniref:CYRIA/CYRIB Rac1 binding domain-containing protein n=1 Tax=Notodromas monacha TaxID=399045 RepID=A0A7R9BGJ9_9CRUS|nr:unnamed protein product [Notodromas monacha]CAG0915091.1 unnamed protein product [Notodromas monacha]